MASNSCVSKNPFSLKEAASNYHLYPAPHAKYEDVAASPKLFMDTLEKLHASMGTKFMIPIIGGRELDLHRLFVEVTSRGGIEKVIKERRWKEVTAVFNFPSTATNASFVLRKYYGSLLNHYEQIYYFKAPGWTASSDPLQSTSTAPVPVPRSQPLHPTVIQSAAFQQSMANAGEFPGAMPASSVGSSVVGVIDGKFETGYLVTVTIGSEKLKGVLYEHPKTPGLQVPQHYSVLVNNNNNASGASIVHRRRRRKKSEIKRRDPDHPKPNRSGYNFFFAEQHARLKPLHQGKDREISKMIGELWSKLKESEKEVYQEKAFRDKERYKAEMEDYRKRQKIDHVISDAVPLQQRLPETDVAMVDADAKMDETDGGEEDSTHTPENESSSSSGYEDDKSTEKDLVLDVSPEVGVGAESSYVYVDMGKSAHVGYELPKMEDNAGNKKAEKIEESKNILAVSREKEIST
ncbi:High mobility group B protein [Quillaja saponaria]|uniref:High mobility group B protein n=1 Tax=Quillaja saponaria TaxID=32244 RepID=A0AAD7LGY1_QUISA|nr:High mobility group B protein [Quillaja saponaria]